MTSKNRFEKGLENRMEDEKVKKAPVKKPATKSKINKADLDADQAKSEQFKNVDDILNSIRGDDKKHVYKTFYLEDEVAKKLKALAKNKNISESKLLNNILKQII